MVLCRQNPLVYKKEKSFHFTTLAAEEQLTVGLYITANICPVQRVNGLNGFFFFLRIRDDGVNTLVLVWASLASVWIVLQNTKQLRRKLHQYLTSISVSALSMTHLLVAHFLFMPALQKTSSASCRSAAKSISPPRHRLRDPQRQISSILHTCFVHAKMDLLNVDSTGRYFFMPHSNAHALTFFTFGWNAHPWPRLEWSPSLVRQKHVHWWTDDLWRSGGSCRGWQIVTSAVFSQGLSRSATLPWVSWTPQRRRETITWTLTFQVMLLRTLRKHLSLKEKFKKKTPPDDFRLLVPWQHMCVFCFYSFAHLMAGQWFEGQQAGDFLCQNFGCSSQPGGSAGWSSKGTWSAPQWFLPNTSPNWKKNQGDSVPSETGAASPPSEATLAQTDTWNVYLESEQVSAA